MEMRLRKHKNRVVKDAAKNPKDLLILKMIELRAEQTTALNGKSPKVGSQFLSLSLENQESIKICPSFLPMRNL